MAVREFRLINQRGDAFDLNNTNHMLIDPDGLGVETEITFATIGDYDIVVSEIDNKPNITGTMYFMEYDDYSKMLLFIKQSKYVLLEYRPPFVSSIFENSNVEPKIFTEVKLLELPKSEKDKDDKFLKSPIVFKRLESWYTKNINSKIIVNDGNEGSMSYDDETEGDGIIYDDETEGAGPIYGTATQGEIELRNYGTAYCYPIITIYGPCSNPTLFAYDYYSGDLIKQIAINTTLIEGDVLVINSDPSNQSVKLNGGNVFGDVNKYYNTEFSLSPGFYNIKYVSSTTPSGNVEIQYKWRFNGI